MTNRIQKIFKKLKAENKKAFVSFSVGGYPDEETSLEISKAIADSGAHIHEISYPHAEAQADGRGGQDWTAIFDMLLKKQLLRS